MIKFFFLMILFFMGGPPLKADEAPRGDDREFKAQLDSIKSPFEDGLPKPIVIINKPTHNGEPKSIVPGRKPKAVSPPAISLPTLDLQGVMVGEDMHQAIIDDTIVPVGGSIKGAKVDSVTKQGVELFFKGKKFFLKVD